MIRLAVFGFLALAVAFIVTSVYSRSVRREKLEDEWEAEVKTGDRAAYVKDGMSDYDEGWRKKMLWLIFVIPAIAVVALVYLNNFS